ncbi:MAG: CRTAC1 family protein, partial [Rhodobacteraceae bacterium]|nr:CRTAC1 family protein [Paracoccaceae bacterium]
CALSMLFTDWNRSGTPSLRVSNDREYYEGGQEQMWQILPEQAPRILTEKDGWKKLKIWGMGIASTDLDGDGYPDYFLTSMADNKLQMLADPVGGKPVYKDVAFARGVTAHRPYTGGDLRPSTAWHAQFEDVNNDGLTDLFVAKGNVSAMPDFAQKDPNNLLLQKPDGTFMEVGDKAGVASMENARGAVLADFNMDGRLDLLVVNRNSPAQIWRNVTDATGNWLGLALHQPGTNPDGVGAWIEVKLGARILRREITVGGGHAGGQAGWWHFGLGTLSGAEVRVIWPDGRAEGWQKLAPNGFYTLAPDQPAKAWSAP